jgi:hypothetical protein
MGPLRDPRGHELVSHFTELFLSTIRPGMLEEVINCLGKRGIERRQSSKALEGFFSTSLR